MPETNSIFARQLKCPKMNLIHPYTCQKEKLKRTNKYLRTIKPLLLILRGLGRLPILFENGQAVFKPLSWPVWYTLLIVVLQFLGTCYILETILFQILTRGNIDDSLYCVALAVSVFQSIAVPIIHLLETSNSLSYVDDWYYFQMEFGKDDLDFALAGPIKVLCIIHGSILSLLLVGGAYLLNDFRFIIFLPCLTAWGSHGTVLMFWSITLYELRAAADKLLKRIIAAGCRNMCQHRILWLKLSNLTTTLGESVGHTGLAICVLLFTNFVLTTYGVLSLAIDQSFTKSFFALLLISVFCMSVQFIMCDAAHRTTQAVGEKFSSKLLELSTSSLSEKDRFEMTFLLQTMMTNPPVIHFLGYVIVDRNLFVKFVSDTVTYLVVLIQFKTSSFARSLVNVSNEVTN